MTKNRTVVEINGRQYDANTGKIVMESPSQAKLIDGFQAPISAPVATPRTRKVNSSSELHQKPQKTKKLHPSAAKTIAVPKKVGSTSAGIKKPAVADTTESKIPNESQARAERSKTHKRSNLVTRFKKSESVDEPIQAQPEPDMPAVERPLPKPEVERPSAAPQPEPEVAGEEKQPGVLKRLRARRPKLIPATMTALLVFSAVGYIAYRNIPNMALRVAAQRAGFNASLPGYSPSGFSFAGPVAYSEGIVELEYKSNSDDRTYQLIQRESPWDSESLLDNFVANTGNDYLTFQERGLTVYIYDTSNATWVDGGVWYIVEGQSLLSSEQLLKIAGSL